MIVGALTSVLVIGVTLVLLNRRLHAGRAARFAERRR